LSVTVLMKVTSVVDGNDADLVTMLMKGIILLMMMVIPLLVTSMVVGNATDNVNDYHQQTYFV
jgi:hypothetical protein